MHGMLSLQFELIIAYFILGFDDSGKQYINLRYLGYSALSDTSFII